MIIQYESTSMTHRFQPILAPASCCDPKIVLICVCYGLASLEVGFPNLFATAVLTFSCVLMNRGELIFS